MTHPTAIYGQPGTYELSLTANVVQLQMTAFHWPSGQWMDQDIDDVFGDPDLYFVLSGPQGPFYTSPTVENSLTLSLADLSVVILNEQTHHVDFYDRDVITWSFMRPGLGQGDNR